MGVTEHVDQPLRLLRSHTSFIGREHEIAEACRLVVLEDVCLLTLTGPGGVGKTRLALQVAAEVADHFRDGVAFVSLAPIVSPHLVLAAIAQTIGVQESGTRPIADGLVMWLHERSTLVVLDNLEHVIDVAPQIADLLNACPRLTILATSRIPLHISAEREYSVAPLALPDRVDFLSLNSPGQASAIRLFIERARAVMPSFILTQHNAVSVAEICRQLDGLPLAIELAAARCKVLSPQTLAARLTQQLTLLTGGPRDVPARQQTMRDTIAWSFDLLDPGEQRLCRQLAVFRGGWTLEAAEAVIDSERDVIEGLSALVDHSLVLQVEQADGTTRLGMLETIRAFGLEQLAAHDAGDATRDRHAEYFLRLAEEAESQLDGPATRAWLDRLERERDNLRAALNWFRECGDVERGLQLAGSLRDFWFMCGYLSEGMSHARAFLDLPGATAAMPARVTALAAIGWLSMWMGDYQRATQLSEEGLAGAQRLGEQRAVPFLLLSLGMSAQLQGDVERARSCWERCRALARDLGDTPNLVRSTNHLGNLARLEGDGGLAASRFEEGLALARAAGLRQECGLSLLQLGILAEQQDDYRRAAAFYRESLANFLDLRMQWGVARLVERLAGIARAEGKMARSAHLYAAASVLRERIGWSWPIMAEHRNDYDRSIAIVRATLGDETFEAAWAEGQIKAIEEVIAEALDIPLPAVVAEPAAAGLTPREVEVLRLIVEGRSNQEIATALFISQHTAASHVAHILSKLGLDSRTAAATWAMRHGFA
jgi:predicted ATPase/DNA-binding CsgD family transcriptional regulator